MNLTPSSYSKNILPIIRRVREKLLPYYGKIASHDKKSEKVFEIVTELDISTEQFLKSEFFKLYPDIGFVGEENGGDRTARRFWLVDPIDGTSYFTRGMPFCTCQVALIENGQVVFSAIYDFVNDLMYSAEKGNGTFVNGAPIHVSNRSLCHSRLSVETHLEKKENYQQYISAREKCVLLTIGCSGFEFAMVASGKLDGRLCFDGYGKDYDFAPGAFLVGEAGGKVANIGKTTYDYRNLNFIASNPIVFRELTEGKDAVFPIERNGLHVFGPSA